MNTPKVGQSPTLSIFGWKATKKQVAIMAAVAAIIAAGSFIACAHTPQYSTAHWVSLGAGGASGITAFVLAGQLINMSCTKPKKTKETLPLTRSGV